MALGSKVFKSAGLFTAGFAALSAAAAAGLRWQLFRRPLPQTSGRVTVPGAEGHDRDQPRPLGRPAHPRPFAARPLVRAGLLPGPGPAVAAPDLQAARLRADRRVRRRAGASGRPVHAHPGTAADRAARGGRAGSRGRRRARRLWRRDQRGRRGPPAAGRVPAAADEVGALAGRRLADGREAARLRPLDQLGARAAASRDGAQPGRGPGGAPRPLLSRRATRWS